MSHRQSLVLITLLTVLVSVFIFAPSATIDAASSRLTTGNALGNVFFGTQLFPRDWSISIHRMMPFAVGGTPEITPESTAEATTEATPAPSTVTSCGVPRPAGSVVGDVPLRAQVYYEPGKISANIFLNPGTYIVIGQDESESYYKVILACQYVWIEKDSVQPSYQSPQNGAPLPTRVVGL